MEYSLDYSKLTVFFKEGDEGRASSLLRDAGLDDEELGLHLVAQKRSLAELRDYRDDVVTHLEKGGVDGRVTIDTEANAATGTANGYAMVSGGYPDRTCGVPPGGAPPPPREIFVARVQGVKVYDPGAAIGGFSR
ncbi:hypothetical protein [Tessaracoccus massiliensis]|uniref:hypothetical protein n=1 Tax=Tessaracoccus massiliensis TaxID=1522311 RepID=UPI00111B290E|nr:hypothetical protein [Tessaracoccus massiliensis]